MKNLPDKIYLNLNMTPQEIIETKDKDFHEATRTWEITWSEECLSEYDPEYIRKDAFIEKACKYWYQYNRNIVKRHGAKAVLGCSEFTVNIEGFKKYMEDKT